MEKCFLKKYFMTIWNMLRYNLWPFGIVRGHLVYFLRFGMFGPRKIWQPCDEQHQQKKHKMGIYNCKIEEGTT
jgi:hypothetical protein